ncbi:hypothetical protein Leryth_021371 [Lithospermum erythrorhizon]|nr:hypothetical protein Leryth_021371 [Lithospermum erythrorhizon]
MRLRNNKTTFRDVQETMQYKVHGSLHKHKTIPCPNVCDGRVTKWIINSGYGARIWNPLSRKYQRLGIFKSAEEASMAYLAKKAEFQKLVMVKGKKGTKGVVCDAQTSSKKFVGVSKQTINSGYGARIWNPLSRKCQRLGIFKSAEEASMAYMAKKAEFQKLVKGKKGTHGVVCDEKIKKVIDEREQCLENQDSGLQVDSRKGWISKGKKKCDMLEKNMAGVSKRKNGKYCARITHPISKKRIWLGTFSSAEEAAMVYLEKKTELEKETQGLDLLFAKMMESRKVLISWVQFYKKIIMIHV